MLAESKIVDVTKSNRTLNEKKDEKRALKGSKNIWFSEIITKRSISFPLKSIDSYRQKVK